VLCLLCYLVVLERLAEETDATNELIIDDGMVQPLSTEEIEALKSSGVHVSVCSQPSLITLASRSLTGTPQEIIKKQTEQHAAFKLKNEYSKEKYKKRKEAK
jgi:tRNA (adenine-N(1)-)-methyltransferase non-catalytic subunit